LPDGHKWHECIMRAASIVGGGVSQVKLSKPKTIGGVDFLLYGRLDTLKAGTIYDLKFSKTYEAGKYIDSTQHPMYLELELGAIDFQYVVSDGKDVFLETYRREDVRPIEDTIAEFMDFLRLSGLDGVYFEYWKARGGL